MTLFRQLIIAVLVLFVVLFAGNTIVGLINARTLVERQMQVHAQDTATSVGLSMTQAAQENDVASLDTLFNAVSDSGFYRRIYFANLDGDIIIDREFPVAVEGVPDWFVSLMDLPSPKGEAEVSSGWLRLGQVAVVSHPGQAYRKLWDITLQQLSWLAIITAAVCALAYFALKWLLVPLKRVEAQADAICEQQFPIQEEMPATRELKRVVEAMNRMSRKLKQVFEDQLELIKRLQVQSYRDGVTGLSNRADFDSRLNSFVRSESGVHSGMLMIVTICDFARVNELAGRATGNQILRNFGQNLAKVVAGYGRAIVARRQGPEITLFVPDLPPEDAETLAGEIFSQALALEWSHQDTNPLTVNMGYTYQQEILNGPELLSEADLALRQSITQGTNQWCKFQEMTSAEAPILASPAIEWQTFLERAIAEQSIELYYQETFAIPVREPVEREVFTRFRESESLISAGVVMPMAERFGMAPAMDQLVLEVLAARLPRSDRRHYCINLCSASIQSDEFLKWIGEFLSSHKVLARRLVFEVSEHALHVEEPYIRKLEAILSRNRAGLAIDHFGLETSAFAYLSSLPLQYLKVHRSFTKQLESNPDNQFYIRSLAQLAHSREIRLIVEGVETEAEWDALNELGVDTAQGFYLGELKPLVQ